MKIILKTEKCASCEFCALACPEMFFMNSSGKAEPILQTIPLFCTSGCQLAIRGCPVSAITIDKN